MTADVFLCYHTDDAAAVEELALRLRAKGIRPWLDEWHIVPGTPWMPSVERALDSCQACAVFVGPSGISPWQHEQMRVAISQRVERSAHQYRVIPVLLPGARRGERAGMPAFLRDTTWVEFRTTLADERALHRLVCGVCGQEPELGPTADDSAQPYQGLEAFDVAQSRFFFGREALVDWLVDSVGASLNARPTCRFLPIVGSSGSGKSSLVRAGLLAALGRDALPGSRNWPALVMTPGAQPLQRLAQALVSPLSSGGPTLNSAVAADALASDARGLDGLIRLGMRDAPEDQRLVLVVDQFEELFTLCDDQEQRERFVAALVYAACAVLGRAVVLIVLRSDFYSHCASLSDLAALLASRQMLLGPLSRVELRRAIERPARAVRYEFEDELVDQILVDAGDRMELPLIQYALLRLWSRRDRDRRLLTKQAYQAIGGVQGALEQHAEQVYETLSGSDQAVCRLVMLDLILPGDKDNDARQPGTLSGLAPRVPDRSRVARVVEHLAGADARLLVVEQEADQAEARVQIAHETLIRSWQRLGRWVDEVRAQLNLREELKYMAARWERAGRKRSLLFTDRSLDDLAAVQERGGLSQGESTFLKQTMRELRHRRRSAVVWAMLFMLATILLTLAVQNLLLPWRSSGLGLVIDDPLRGLTLVDNPANDLVVSGGSQPVYYVATKDIGVGRSEDGVRWQFAPAAQQALPTGTPAENDSNKIVSTITYLAVDPLDPNHLLAAVRFNYIYRSDNGAKRWYKSDKGVDLAVLSDLPLVGLDVRGDVAVSVFQEATFGDLQASAGKIFVSRNGGSDWAEHTPVGGMSIFTARIAPDGDFIYVGTSAGVYRALVPQAPTAPLIWERIADLPPAIRIAFRQSDRGDRTDDVLYLVPDQQASEKLSVMCWKAGMTPRMMGPLKDQVLELAPRSEALYMLLFNGEVLKFALNQDGCGDLQHPESLSSPPGIVFSLLALPRREGGTRLLVGYESGILEYNPSGSIWTRLQELFLKQFCR